MPKTADRCKDTTTTTGTGTITISGTPPTGFQSFATAFAVGSPVMYAIIGSSGEWEVGRGALLTSTTISRDIVRSSSNSNALVNFSAGTKDVFATVTAEYLDNGNLGLQIAMNRACALP